MSNTINGFSINNFLSVEVAISVWGASPNCKLVVRWSGEIPIRARLRETFVLRTGYTHYSFFGDLEMLPLFVL